MQHTLYATLVHTGMGPHGLVDEHGEYDGYHDERKRQHLHGINCDGYFCADG